MDKYGRRRALDPPNSFPQFATRLDASPVIEASELLLAVSHLNLDSNSFRQLKEQCNQDVSLLKELVLNLVRTQGKMHNPITHSGGMLIGTVTEKGAQYPGVVRVGDTVASLVSLTLTPLLIEEIEIISLHSAQLQIRGQAVLFASAPCCVLPADIEVQVALSVLDVCGAPRRMQVHAGAGDNILILGAGKSGLLCAYAALTKRANTVTLFERSLARIAQLKHLAVPFQLRQVDVSRSAEYLAHENRYDVVFDCTNVPNVEMASIICAKNSGTILFFNTATSFTQAALGAEGIGKFTTLIIGSGYYPDHAEFAFGLIRRYPVLYQLLNEQSN